MGLKTVSYITCDQCGREREAHIRIMNKKMQQSQAKAIGFCTSADGEFCSEICKQTYKLNKNKD